MNVLKKIFWKLPDHKSRIKYANVMSTVCKLLFIKTAKGNLQGIPIYVSSDDNWGLRKFYFRDDYNLSQIKGLKRILETDRFVFWDIGANYGAYTLLLSQEADCTVAIEPMKKTFQCLKKNCSSLKAKIILEHCAIGERSGECELFIAEGFSADNRIFKPSQESRKSEKKKLKALDDIVRTHFKSSPAKNLLKIDVQGAEVGVLKGAEKLISESEKIIVMMEVWPRGLEDAGSTLDDLIAACCKSGLQLVNDSYEPRAWNSVIEEIEKSESGNTDVLLVKG